MGSVQGCDPVRIGLVARADYTGLGIQTHDFYRHMTPDKTLVVDLHHLNGQTNDMSRYPGAQVLSYTPYPDTRRSHPDAIRAFRDFLKDIDVVFTCETPYDYFLFEEAQRRGVKTVLQYNFELLDHVSEPDLPRPDLFMAPSLWRYDEIAFPNKVFVPVPVDRSRFPARPKTEARVFVHPGGNPAMEDRNGTQVLLDAWRMVKSDVSLVCYTQWGAYAAPDSRVKIRRGTVPDQAQFYDGADVFVMPRKFGGLCLPLNEALSSALPAVMTDLDPQRAFLDPRLLVPTWHSRQAMAKCPIDIYEPHADALANKIDLLASNPDLVAESSAHSEAVAERISWERLAPLYRDVFESVVEGKTPQQEFSW